MSEHEIKIAVEAATVEFNRFVESWDIDANEDSMSGEDKEEFNKQKDRILRAIIKGHATIDESGDISFIPNYSEKKDTIIFKIPRGAAYLAMDSFKDRQNIHKLYGFMGSMTKQPAKLFSNMDARDSRFCMGITLLFLGS